MTCQNPDCKKEIDHEDAARLVTSDEFIQVIVNCPHCGAEHCESFRPDDMVLID